MKKSAFANYPEFFMQIVYDACVQESFWKKIQMLKIEARDWPSCAAKLSMFDFEFLARTRSWETAAFEVSNRAEVKRSSIVLPDTPTELIAVYRAYTEFGKYHQLGQKLISDPMSGSELIKDVNFEKSLVDRIDLNSLVPEAFKEREKHISQGTSIIELEGWPLLSNIVGGFNPGRVGIITGKTGVGKTNIAINLSRAASATAPVLYFNMEMIRSDLVERFLMSESQVTFRDWKTKVFDQNLETKFTKASDSFKQRHPIYITDGRALSLSEVVTTIFFDATDKGVRFVFIDYDQKIRSESFQNEWQELQRSVEELEEIAKKTNTFILVFAQADDAGDPRASKRTKQSASFVFHFKELEEKIFGKEYVLEGIKNRFGQNNQIISIEYAPDRAHCREAGLKEKSPIEQPKSKFSENPYPGRF